VDTFSYQCSWPLLNQQGGKGLFSDLTAPMRQTVLL